MLTESLGEVNAKAGSVSRLVDDIARACSEQVQGISAVTEAIARLGEMASGAESGGGAELVRIRRR